MGIIITFIIVFVIALIAFHNIRGLPKPGSMFYGLSRKDLNYIDSLMKIMKTDDVILYGKIGTKLLRYKKQLSKSKYENLKKEIKKDVIKESINKNM